jgi:hypothetical protein
LIQERFEWIIGSNIRGQIGNYKQLTLKQQQLLSMSNFNQASRGFRGGFSSQSVGAARFPGQQQQHHHQFREDSNRSGPSFRGGRPVGMMG